MLRVLVIDDSLIIRAMLEQLIQREKTMIAGLAADVATARAMIVSFDPDVITLDLSMPDVDGLSFLDEIRGKHHAPVIVVSGSTRGDDEVSAEAIRRGAIACIDKTRVTQEAPTFLRILKKLAKYKGWRHRSEAEHLRDVIQDVRHEKAVAQATTEAMRIS